MSDEEQKTDQSPEITKVQCGESMSFIEVSYRKAGKALLSGTEMIKRRLYHKVTLGRQKYMEITF